MKFKKIWLFLIILFLAFSSAPALATTWKPQVFRLSYQVKRADAIVTGRVIKLSPQDNTTLVLFEVAQWFKWAHEHELKKHIIIVTEKGKRGAIAGAPEFKIGEKALLMLTHRTLEQSEKIDGRYVVLGGFAGEGRYGVLFMDIGKHPLNHRSQVLKLTKKRPRRPFQEVIYLLDSGKQPRIMLLSPDTGKTLATIAAGIDKQIAVTADGKKLYLTDTPTKGQNTWRDRLRVFETRRFRSLGRVFLANRAKTHEFAFIPTMILSESGKRLYVLKTGAGSRQPPYKFWVSKIRTKTLKEVGRIELGDNVSRPLWADGSKLVLGMGADAQGSKANLHQVIDVGKEKLVKTLELPRLIRPGGKGMYDGSNSVQVRGGDAKDGFSFYYVKDKDGGGKAQIDVVAAYQFIGDTIRTNPSTVRPSIVKNVELRLPRGWQASGEIALPDNGLRLYVGVGKFKNTSQGLNDRVLILDNYNPSRIRPSLKRLGVIKPPKPFAQLAVSKDGTRLYLLNAYQDSLRIYDVADPAKPKIRRLIRFGRDSTISGMVPAIRS